MVDLKWNNASADRPIHSRSEDLLGRADFACKLAQVISTWNGKDSLVIALNGAWGSGKSSLKNLILESLANSQDSPRIVEFNPWQWSGQRRISTSFFEEIGRQLGRRDASSELKNIARKFRRLGSYLNTGVAITKGIKDFLPVLFTALTIGAGILGYLKPEWGKATAAAMVALATSAGAVLLFGERVATALARHYAKLSTEDANSLEELKTEVSDLLNARKANILVVIDDIDRLSPEETKLVFQLVKANGDLPRVVYLLLFERVLVAENLRRAGFPNGDEFLEKIIQAGFEVPNVERARLDEVLIKGLNGLLSDSQSDALTDPHRFANLYHSGVRDYFRSLRDVYRFLSTFAVHAAVHRRGGGFEVNPIDLIGIEVLRIFEPQIYVEVRSNKPLLTQASRSALRDNQRREDAAAIQRIVEQASEMNRSSAKGILEQLFPACPWGNVHRNIDDSWFRERRVAHPDAFDRYFVLAIPHGDVSHAEVDELLSVARDREALVRKLNSFLERGLLNAILDRLEAYKEEIPISLAVPFLTGLFDFGDSMPKELNTLDDAIQGTPVIHAVRIIHFFLKREPREEERVRILQECLNASTGIFLPAKVVSNQERLPSREREEVFLVPESAYESLKGVVLGRIRQLAVDLRLANQKDLWTILFDWRKWAGAEEPKAWVARLIESHEGVLKFLCSFMTKGTVASLEDRVARVLFRMPLRQMEDYVDLNALESKVNGIARDNLSETELKALEAFQASTERRRRRGETDESSIEDL